MAPIETQGIALNTKQIDGSAEEKEWQFRSIFDAASDGMIIQDLESGEVVEANPAACVMHGYTRDEFIGLPVSAYVHAESRHIFKDYLRVYRMDGGLDAQVTHVCKDGSSFPAEWRGMAVNIQGRMCLVGIVRDITKRVRAEELLLQRVEQRAHEQAKLLEISLTLASTLEFDPGLILDQLREVIPFTQGGLFELQESILVTLAARGSNSAANTWLMRADLKDPEARAALYNGHRPICLGNIQEDQPQANAVRAILGGDELGLLDGAASWLWVPLAVGGKIIGGIGVTHEMRNVFTPHQANLALSIANLAAITMVNAALYRDAQSIAIMEERQRLAHNLHDAINQSLFSAGLIAEVLPRLWERDQEEARLAVGDLLHLTRGAQAEMRALLAELRPATLTDSNLGDLLRLLAHALTGRTNIPVKVEIENEPFLPAEIQIAFYRVCQEALSNVAKHSNATNVEIYLRQIQEKVEMRIVDNGDGFDLSQIVPGHYGVSMMKERAEGVNAQIAITSQPGTGTQVNLIWVKGSAREML